HVPFTAVTVAVTRRNPPGESENGAPPGEALTRLKFLSSRQSTTIAVFGVEGGVTSWTFGFGVASPRNTRPSSARLRRATRSASKASPDVYRNRSGEDVAPAAPAAAYARHIPR